MLTAILLTIHICFIPISFVLRRVANGINEFGSTLGWVSSKKETRLESFLKSLVWEIPLLGELASYLWSKFQKTNL